MYRRAGSSVLTFAHCDVAYCAKLRQNSDLTKENPIYFAVVCTSFPPCRV